MFKRSRRKIVAAIMAVLVILFLGTLGIIYGSSYFEVAERNREMLERYVELYSLEEQPGEDKIFNGKPRLDIEKFSKDKFDKNGLYFEDTPVFRLTTFYSVAISENGDILATDNDGMEIYSNDELEKIARAIKEGGKSTGIQGNLIYHMVDKESYTLVAFMDNTIIQESMTTLFRYTFLFGTIAILFLFFVALYLAKKIVQPLEESYKKQKQFISDAGHELKTPVSVVNANIELLFREIGHNQWLSNIQYENERMGILIAQLLELARTETIIPQMERVEFSHLVDGEILPFESVAFEKGLKLQYDIADKIYIRGNIIQLKQLVGILIDNAIEHSLAGKEVILTLKEERNFAVLTVINAGDEIPAEQCKQIFERFYRMDSARSGDDKHYGLGLSIAKAIVTTHKGKIHVKCYDGKVEFTVCIPL